MSARKQIRFNDLQLKELDLLKAKTRVSHDSEAVHIAIQYALKYFEVVTNALETREFELALLRRTKYYSKKNNKDMKNFG